MNSRILIVDDVLEMRTLLKSIVKTHGYDSVEASNGKTALEALRNDLSIKILLVDLGLDDMSGTELISKIQSDRKARGLKIICVSGKREKEDIAAALRAGVDDYVVKPVDPKILLNKLKSLITGSQQTSFVNLPVNFSAQLANAAIEITLQLTNLSEEGVTILTPFSLTIGAPIEIIVPKLELAAKIGHHLNCKVIEVHKSQKHFLAKLNFVGLPETSAAAIRAFIFQESTRLAHVRKGS